MRDRLEGADRDTELPPLGDVGHGHVERALADADELGRERAGAASGDVAPECRPLPRHLRVAARRVDRLEPGDVRVGAVDHPRAAILDQDDHGGAVGVGREAGAAEATGQLAGRQPGEPAGALRVGPAVLERERGERGAEERGRRDRVAELLEQDRQLDGAQPLAAVLLGDRDPGPAERAQLGPQLGVVDARLRRRADPREG